RRSSSESIRPARMTIAPMPTARTRSDSSAFSFLAAVRPWPLTNIRLSGSVMPVANQDVDPDGSGRRRGWAAQESALAHGHGRRYGSEVDPNDPWKHRSEPPLVAGTASGAAPHSLGCRSGSAPRLEPPRD